MPCICQTGPSPDMVASADHAYIYTWTGDQVRIWYWSDGWREMPNQPSQPKTVHVGYPGWDMQTK